MRYNASSIWGGVWLENCELAEVKNNFINSLSAPYGSGNWDLRGIYIKSSTNNKVYCNTLASLGQCMVFEGGCTSATASGYGIKANSMDDSRTGLMLRTTGVIGTQGNTGIPNGNTWNNSFTFSDGRTYTYSTNNANTASILYCTAGGSTFPPSSPTNTNKTNVATQEYNIGLLTATSGSAIDCPTEEVPAGMIIMQSHNRSFEDAGAYTEELKALLNGSNGENFSAADWSMQNFIYNEVANNSVLQEDTTLNNFYITHQNSSYGQFSDVAAAIQDSNYVQATSLNSNVSAANPIEENQQGFYEIYLSHLDSLNAYSEAEIETLYAIANQCALEGGAAVVQSRNLLMGIENKMISFTEDCEENNNEYRSFQKPVVALPTVNVYPNPGNGIITLECYLKDNESAELLIYTITGNVIQSYPINLGAKSTRIDASVLQSGMYIYELRINGKICFKNKLSIIK
jgi:hypothetical protein